MSKFRENSYAILLEEKEGRMVSLFVANPTNFICNQSNDLGHLHGDRKS